MSELKFRVCKRCALPYRICLVEGRCAANYNSRKVRNCEVEWNKTMESFKEFMEEVNFGKPFKRGYGDWGVRVRVPHARA